MNVNLSADFERETCVRCGCEFFIPTIMHRNLKNNGGTFYCPNGHPQSYVEPEVEKYKRLYEQSEKYRVNAVANANAYKAEVGRLSLLVDDLKRKQRKPRAKKVKE